MNKIKEPPFKITARILNLVAEICEIITTLKLNHKTSLIPHLRRKNLIRTIYGSLIIENNTLSIE